LLWSGNGFMIGISGENAAYGPFPRKIHGPIGHSHRETLLTYLRQHTQPLVVVTPLPV
jgi:hypothetical protein